VSLPTPTGNPLPYGPDAHECLFNWHVNQQWIARESREGETVEQTLDRMAAELSTYYPGFPPLDWRVLPVPTQWTVP
jgi:hypothetical protein